jgi:hypothetical protein
MTLCVASQRMFIVIVYFFIDSVRKLLDTPSYRRHVFRHIILRFHFVTRKLRLPVTFRIIYTPTQTGP